MLSILLSQDMHFSFYLPIKIFVCNFIQYNRNFNSFLVHYFLFTHFLFYNAVTLYKLTVSVYC
jgi:hypothetical protein